MKQVLLPFICILLFTSCHKECNDIVTYVFELPATLSPAKDTFRIGDTITITSEFSDMVYERKTNKSYKLEGWRFYPSTGVYRTDSIDALSLIIHDFNVLIDSQFEYRSTGYSDGSQFLTGQYLYEDNKYVLKYKIIPKKKGLFYLEFASSLYPQGQHQNFEGRCPKSRAGLDAAVKLNDGADNNIHMLSSSPDPHYHDWILQKRDEPFHKFGGYCFYVKE